MPSIRIKDITLVNMYVNEVNEVLKNIPVHNLIKLKNVARPVAFLVCEKVGIRGDQGKMLKNHSGRGE